MISGIPKIPAYGPCKIIPSLLCKHYNLYLSLYLHTIKLKHDLRNSKIPAYGPCKIIPSLLCKHYNPYLSSYFYTIKLKQDLRNFKIPAHGPSKSFCLYCAGITTYIHPSSYIQASVNRFSGIPRSLHMAHAKYFCLYCAGITT